MLKLTSFQGEPEELFDQEMPNVIEFSLSINDKEELISLKIQKNNLSGELRAYDRNFTFDAQIDPQLTVKKSTNVKEANIDPAIPTAMKVIKMVSGRLSERIQEIQSTQTL